MDSHQDSRNVSGEAVATQWPLMDFYIPDEALQGQDVPGHVLWPDSERAELRITFPEYLRVKAVYNAKSEDFTIEGNTLSVSRVKREGYLGFVFSSSRSTELVFAAEIQLDFTLNGKEAVRATRSVRLFRPTLEAGIVPTTISIDESGKPDRRIRLIHRGAGTLFVSLESTDASAIKLSIPDDLIRAFKQFAEDLSARLEKIRKLYPQYERFFEAMEKADFTKRDEAINLVSQEAKELDLSRDFLERVGNAFVGSLLQSSDFETAFIRPITDFIKSAVAPGVIFTTPFLEFPRNVSDGELILRIVAKDLMRFETANLTTQPIRIRNTSGVNVPVGQIIDWVESGAEDQ